MQVVPRSPVWQGGREAAGEGPQRELPGPRVAVQARGLRALSQVGRQGHALHDTLHGESACLLLGCSRYYLGLAGLFSSLLRPGKP